MMTKCYECGAKLAEKNLKGRSFPYMSLTKLVLTHDFNTLACTKCDNYCMKSSDCKTLDRALVLSLCDFYKENTTPKPFLTMDVTDEEVEGLPD